MFDDSYDYRLPYSLAIRNSGTNALALKDPAVNAKGIDVQLREVQRGRLFTVTLTFPAGFDVTAGEQIELSVKSNHPQFPIIKVPVQTRRQAPIAVPPRG